MTKKTNAQSKDFEEIRNTQSEMSVSQEEWDRIWHNYKEPDKCAGRKHAAGCTICNQLIANQIKDTDDGIETSFP